MEWQHVFIPSRRQWHNKHNKYNHMQIYIPDFSLTLSQEVYTRFDHLTVQLIEAFQLTLYIQLLYITCHLSGCLEERCNLYNPATNSYKYQTQQITQI